MMKSPYILMMFIYLMFLIIYMFMMNYLHPIFMAIMLIFYTIMTCVIMSMWSYNYIYSIMLFMIMISGLLILFLYFSSLISNVKNKVIITPMMLFNSIIYLLVLNFMLNNSIFMNFIPYMNKEINTLMSINKNLFQNIWYIYMFPYSNFTILVILYLLICLLSIIKLCTIKSSSLRKLT